MARVDAHRIGEERSLALHRLIAERIRSEPGLVNEALERIERWRESGTLCDWYARRWRELLAGDRDELLRTLVDPGEASRELRQTTPFAGVIDARTRWRVWREVREELEAT
jgi:hypothetical protein